MNPNKRPIAPSNGGDMPAVMCFMAGVTAVLMGYSVYSHLKTLRDRSNLPKKSTNKTGTKLEDSIRLKSLAYLTQSHNVNIQSSSIKIILERAMSASYLQKIIAACDKDQPIDIRSKALPSLQLLTRKENNKATLVDAGALRVLVDALKCTDPGMKEVTQRYVAVAICDLVQGSEANKYCILELGVLEPIKRILTSKEIRNNELKYWTLMILYQISLSDPLPKVLIENGFVSLLARMARMTYGNTNMPKFCMQSLVRIAANVDVSEAKKVLNELLDYNIVDLISNCLRGDDVELIYWAAGLMHEFVLKDVAADKFREIKGIHVILAGLLSAEEMYISRVILRTIKFMAFGQDKFRREMVRSGMVKKVMHCLSLDDEDVRYWAILCIHVVAGQVESHEDIISAPEFEVLLELALSSKIKVAIFVSDILSLICCISHNSTFMEPNIGLIIKTLDALLNEGELDVQYNAAGAIFNVMTMTFAFANKVRHTCFKSLIRMSKSAAHERVQLSCTKGALMVAIKNRSLIPKINHDVTEPLVEVVNSITQSLLPIIIAQALAQAAKEEPSSANTGFSIHDAMNGEMIDEFQYLDIERQNPLTRTYIDEEDEEENEQFPRPLDYIDVSDQGTISNATRLDRVLKERENPTKLNKQNSSPLSHADISYLFDTNIPTIQREALLMKFEVPSSTRSQLMGALTALNILMENDQIVGNMMAGESFKYPIMDVIDGIDDIAASIYNNRIAMNEDIMLGTSPSHQKNILEACINPAEATGYPLHDGIRHLIQGLVYLSLQPVLEEWATIHHRRYPLRSMTETKASGIYADVVHWICARAEITEHHKRKQILDERRSIEDDSNSSDIDSCSSDESDLVSVHKQLHRAQSSRSVVHNANESSSDSEDQIDSDDDQRLTETTMPRKQRRKVESAAERMGETRRKGEHFDLDDTLSASYASEYYLGFSNRALVLLNSLMRYASVRQYLVQDAHIIPVLFCLFQDHISLTDRVMACLGGLFAHTPALAIPESSFQVIAILLLRGLKNTALYRKKSYIFYARLVLSYCSRYASVHFQHPSIDPVIIENDNPTFVEIDLVSCSKHCLINQENRLQVRNDSWTFETIRATHCVPALLDKDDKDDEEDQDETHKYAFEVILESNGLMQVGWVTEHFQFDSEGGKGVGDDTHSYGYDGNRSKKWHGRYNGMRTSYGLKWAEGDVITCAIDMDVGEIRYYKNGEDMGVAFYGVLVSRAWYPAISLATGQQCKFRFGGAIDPLRYLPAGYTSVGALALQSPVNVELPPPHFAKPTVSTEESEEADILDLSKALERMNFNSPVSSEENDGNVEPNLKPVDGRMASRSLQKDTLLEDLQLKEPHQKHEFSLDIEISDVYHKPSPSLYFEASVGFLPKQLEDLSSQESLITFGLRGLTSNGTFYIEYNRIEQLCCFVLGELRSKPFRIIINDGDVIGLIYIDELSEAGFTLNGTVKAFVSFGESMKSRPYLPFVTGCMKSEINYGEEPFVWQYVDKSLSTKRHMSNYLSEFISNSGMTL